MAYQMIHLEIAYRLLEKFTWIVKREDFLLGAIDPGAKKKQDFVVCQKTFEKWFHKENILYGGIMLVLTCGIGRFFTKDILTNKQFGYRIKLLRTWK